MDIREINVSILPSSLSRRLNDLATQSVGILASEDMRNLKIRITSRDGAFVVNSNMMNAIGVNEEKFTFILKSFGYVVIKKDKLLNVSRKKSGKRTSNKLRKQKTVRAVNSDSPFAILAKLKTGPQS